MTGERVAVLRRSEAGRDEMGEPTYSWSHEVVENCLVRPMSGSDASDEIRPDGIRVSYRIALPKSYTATMAPLAHCRVALVDRGMDPSDAGAALLVTGSPDRTVPCPTAWDVLVDVGRVDG